MSNGELIPPDKVTCTPATGSLAIHRSTYVKSGKLIRTGEATKRHRCGPAEDFDLVAVEGSESSNRKSAERFCSRGKNSRNDRNEPAVPKVTGAASLTRLLFATVVLSNDKIPICPPTYPFTVIEDVFDNVPEGPVSCELNVNPAFRMIVAPVYVLVFCKFK